MSMLKKDICNAAFNDKNGTTVISNDCCAFFIDIFMITL